MAKISEYTKSTTFTANDVLLKDGSGGTRIITWEDAAAQFGRQIGVPAMQTDIATLKKDISQLSEEIANIPGGKEQLSGTTDELTPTQVYDAVSAGIPVKVQ